MKAIDHHKVYSNAIYYDSLNNFTHDLNFYAQIIEPSLKKDLLELACGTGRLSIPLAKKGFNTTGIDLSEQLLKRAIEKSEEIKNIHFLKMDIRTFRLEKKYDLIILAHNSLCHLHDLESIASCFNSIKKHLKPNGIFAFDVLVPNFKFLTRKKEDIYTTAKYNLINSNIPVLHTESSCYDSKTQINHIKWFVKIKNKTEVFSLNMRMFYPQEIDNYLKLSGFNIISKFGDFELNKFSSKSNKQVFVCKVKNN